MKKTFRNLIKGDHVYKLETNDDLGGFLLGQLTLAELPIEIEEGSFKLTYVESPDVDVIPDLSMDGYVFEPVYSDDIDAMEAFIRESQSKYEQYSNKREECIHNLLKYQVCMENLVNQTIEIKKRLNENNE